MFLELDSVISLNSNLGTNLNPFDSYLHIFYPMMILPHLLCFLGFWVIMAVDLQASHPAMCQFTLLFAEVNKVDARGQNQSVLKRPEEQTFWNLGGQI